MATVTPQAGDYRVIDDRIQEEKEVWGLFCSSKRDKKTPGAKLTLDVDGAEWKATGSGRKFGTRTCEGQNPSLAVVHRERRGKGVFLKCQSRRVTRGTERTEHHVEVLSDTRVRVKSVAERYFKKQGEDCRLRVTRITVASLIPKKAETTPNKPDETVEEAKAKDPCAAPGPVAKLNLSPKVFDAKVGAAPTCLEVLAFDSNSCAVQVKPSFSLDPSDVGKVDAKGCFSASKKVKEEEAAAIVVKAGGLEAAASVRIIPKAKKRAQKSYQALAKTTRSKRAREVLGSVTRGEIVLRPLETDPPPLEDLEDEGPPWLLLGLAVALSLMALLLAVVFAVVRKKQQVAPTDLQAKPVVTPKKGGGLVCPKCKFEFAVGEASHCPFDNTELEELGRDARQTMFVPAAGGMICPTCKTKYPTKARFCGHDRSPLIPDFGQFATDDDAGGQQGGSD